MILNLIKVGNSRGIRLPKVLIEECHLGDKVQVDIRHGIIEVRRLKKPRDRWAESFKKMRKHKDDKMIGTGQSLSGWDEKEWEW